MANAVVPITLLLTLGFALQRRVLTDPGFWRGLEWLTYHVFTPSLFASSIAAADLGLIQPTALIVCVTLPALAATLVLATLRSPLRVEGPAFTSLIQGSTRLNTYIGLVFMSALHGQQGVAIFALAAAVMVPLVNVIAVSALTLYGDSRSGGPRPRIQRELLTNPLIVGCALGLTINVLNLSLPTTLSATLSLLAAPALVCGTLVAGGAIVLRLMPGDAVSIATASALKLVFLPLGAAALAHALGVSGAVLAAVVVICGVPASPSAYIIATKLGGDSRLMASITAVQTALAILTLPLILHLTHAV